MSSTTSSCLPDARLLNGQILQNDGGGLFAMAGRYFQAAAGGFDAKAQRPRSSGSETAEA